jgi:hypothetical protein
MNYIKQLNSFYQLLPSNPINSNAQSLYFFLLNYNNGLGWIKEFTVANSIVMGYTELNISALQRARNALVQKGYIKYQKGISNSAGRYTIVEFEQQSEQQSEQQNEQQSEQQTDNKVNNRTNNTTNTLNKLNKTKQNNKKENIKEKHGKYSHVLLTPAEYEKLKTDYTNAEELITYLDEYIEMKGYKAKSHYLAIKKWVVDAVAERKAKSQQNVDRDKESERQIKMLQDKIAKGEL